MERKANSLLKDPQFVDMAIRSGSTQAYCYAPYELRNDIKRASNALTLSPDVAQYIPNEIRDYLLIAPRL